MYKLLLMVSLAALATAQVRTVRRAPVLPVDRGRAAALPNPNPSMPEMVFTTDGVQADGFVDFSRLPASPTSGPFSAQPVPVAGIPGLTATIQLPSTTSAYIPGGPLYQVVNPADLRVNVPSGKVVVRFNQMVQGVSAVFRVSERFGHTFTMTANYADGSTLGFPGAPPSAQVITSGFDHPSPITQVAPLQLLSKYKDITDITLEVGTDGNENSSFELLNLRIQSGNVPDAAAQITKNGLRAWFAADKFGDGIWPDQSGNRVDAVPPTPDKAPAPTLDGNRGMPVLAFNGGQLLKFPLSITGWTAMTVFLAGQSYADPSWSDNSPLSWNETTGWGKTFLNPFQSRVFFRFGTTQANNQPTYRRRVNMGGDFSVTSSIHNGTVDSLYINGILAMQQSGKLPAIAGAEPLGSIGGSASNIGSPLSYFTGNIGEILIYNRALSDAERSVVERYLMDKYGVR